MNRGFIRYIVIIIAAIILLKFWLHIDVIAWLNKPEVKETFSTIWHTYLKGTIEGLINFIRDIIS